MMHYEKQGMVVTDIRRASAADAQTLARFGVATVHEAMGRQGLMQPSMRPIYPGATLCGSAVTALVHPGDNWMLHVVAEQIRPGDVVVVACTANNTDGMFGDLLATSFKALGAVGLVIDAGVRDVAEIAAIPFPVFSTAIHARGTVKATLGSVNIPVICAGALVQPGDIVLADADGVVVVPLARVSEVIAAAEIRAALETTKRAKLAAGELSLDLYNMRPALQAAGLTYIRQSDLREE
jgi:4-hydroxy-4-methyl-2-oxoglutarate aldolase